MRALMHSGGLSQAAPLRTLIFAVLALIAAMPGINAGAQTTIAITGATVHPVSGPAIDNGTVIIRGSTIVAVGAGIAVPAGAIRIDGSGKWLTPGLFNATTSLGVTEIGAIPGTFDVTAHGQNDAVTASFRVWDGFNPWSPLLQITRNDGITTVGVVPAGGMISGMGAVVALRDGPRNEVVLRGPAAMFADLGSTGPGRGASRGELFQRFRSVLEEARSFPRRRADYERAATRPLAARAQDLEALQPVLRGMMPLIVAADRATDIETTIDVAREFGVRTAVAGATEGWKVASRLSGVYVLTGAMSNIPRSFSTLGARQDNASLLHAAGARVIISGGMEAFNARNVRYEAGVAVSFGMPWEAALRAITLTPAELYGVAARVGSLQPGKDATLVLWSGDPFEPMTRAERVFVSGVEVQGTSRQDELMRRYRTLPPDYRRRP
ncbi:MAG: amidohydrolase family protein [Gemmatimonadota bacterium]